MRCLVLISILWLSIIAVPHSALGQTAADLNEGFQIVAGSTEGEFTLKWFGKSGRTYFIQTSETLMPSDWLYLPEIRSGAGAVIQMGIASSTPWLFFRLQYSDAAYTGTVGDADFDGDKVSNMDELVNNTNPDSNTDTDGDAMPNDWEIAAGSDPADGDDWLADADGDRVPNGYEFEFDTDGGDAESFTPPHITVDPSIPSSGVTAVLKNNIVSAIQEADLDELTIIRVKPGSYDYSFQINRPILMLGDPGGLVRLVGEPGATTARVTSANVLLRDMVFTPQEPVSDYRAVNFNLLNVQSRSGLMNCIVTGHVIGDAAPVRIERGTAVIMNSTIYGNVTHLDFGTASPGNRAGSFSLHAATHAGSTEGLVLRNCIVWNAGSFAPSEIYARASSPLRATDNIILGGLLGGLDVDPLLNRYLSPHPQGPAVRVSAGGGVQKDLHGQPRDGLADYGAVEFVDADVDGLPDWWELRYFANLTVASATSDNDLPLGDGLKNSHEYLLGFDPTNGFSGPDPSMGDHLAALRMSWDADYPADWLVDADGDGLHAGWETYFGSSEAVADTNGDGIPDLAAFWMGLNPASADLDGDGLDGAAELLCGTNPLLADTDGDTVADDLDAYPLDPFMHTLVPGSGDILGPVVTLSKPAEAEAVP